MGHWFHALTGWVSGVSFGAGGGASTMPDEAEASSESVLRVNGITIFPARHRVEVDGCDVELTGMELRILLHLARRPGIVFSRDEIATTLNERRHAVTEAGIAKRVQLLRRKLGVPGEGEALEAVRGVGYVLRPRMQRRAEMAGIAPPAIGWFSRWRDRLTGWKPAALTAAFGGVVLLVAIATVDPPALFGGGSGVQLLGTLRLPAMTIDPSNVMQTLDGSLVDTMPAGFGSGIDYTGSGERYIAVVDRGPDDLPNGFRARYYELTIHVEGRGAGAVRVEVGRPVFLEDEAGRPLRGDVSRIHHAQPDSSADPRFDAEAIRVSPDGLRWIAEEYGPSLAAFDAAGRRVRAMTVPEPFRVRRRHADPLRERVGNSVGRLPNRGFESLAISADGRTLTTATQSQLIQDGGEAGRFLRLLSIDTTDGSATQFVYPLEEPGHGVSELLACGEGRFLVIERDFEFGRHARFKRIYLIQTATATDVSDAASLPASELPTTIQPVTKRLVLDMMSRRFGLNDSRIPEQIEGMCFGPDLSDGRRLLLVTSDSGFGTEAVTWFYAFAIDPGRLVN